MYSRSAKGGKKGDPNRNPWLAKMGLVEITWHNITTHSGVYDARWGGKSRSKTNLRM
jgi:hypothetical protein